MFPYDLPIILLAPNFGFRRALFVKVTLVGDGVQLRWRNPTCLGRAPFCPLLGKPVGGELDVRNNIWLKPVTFVGIYPTIPASMDQFGCHYPGDV